MTATAPPRSARAGGRKSPTAARAAIWTLLLCTLGGSLAGQLPEDAGALRLDLRLDPSSGELEGVATLTLVPTGPSPSPPVLELLSALAVDEVLRVETDGTRSALRLEPIASHSRIGAAEGPGPGLPITRYRVPVDDASDRLVLELRYHGVLQQDWRAGERPGEIHNFEIAAHVGREGVFLSGEAAWYPRPAAVNAAGEPFAGDGIDAGSGDAAAAAAPLLDFEVTVRGVPGMLLVASGNRLDAGGPRRPGVDTTWRSPFPLPDLTVAGGPLSAVSRSAAGVSLWALASEANLGHAQHMLDAAADYLELYQRLLGAYPFRELVIVENFFSSGFAYPGFTLLASQVLAMGEGSLRPGYLDHELLHAWWGNGVLQRPGAGVWSEALASYGANLMRPVLEGRPEESRAQRRSILEALSRTPPGEAKPLASFGLPNGASRLVGYQKGSLVLAQLARELGQDTLWYGLRTLAATRMGEPTSWDDIERVLARAAGRDLRAFFDFWVRGAELPDLSPAAVEWLEEERSVRLRFAEPTPVGSSRLPLVLTRGERSERREVDVAAGAREVVFAAPFRPESIRIDPDHETLRRLPEASWMPTISSLRPPRDLHVLRSAESREAAAAYDGVVEQMRERWRPGAGARSASVAAEPAGSVFESSADRGVPAEGHVLVLGRASEQPWLGDLLREAELRFGAGAASFELAGTRYDSPDASVLACVRRPDEAGAVVCVYSGNSPSALARSHLLGFYGGDSLLVFDGGQPTERRRFERVEELPVP